jgi:hypothetical protein
MTTEICTRTEIDPRGPRFGGTITTIVLAIALVTVGTPLSDVLVVWQALVFGLGAIVGLHAQPYGILYRKLIGPRLAPPQLLEDAAPPLGVGLRNDDSAAVDTTCAKIIDRTLSIIQRICRHG